MSKLSAFVIMPYKQPFEDLYKSVLEVSLVANGFDVKRADEVSASKPFASDIQQFIRSSELIIADISGENLNVYYELGQAHALNKEVILLFHSNGSEIPADIRHLRLLRYDINNVEEFRDKLDQWVKASLAYNSRSRRQSAKVLNRGDIFRTFTDATFYLQQASGLGDKDDIIACIRRGNLVPPKYLYKYDRGCHNWLDLCQDPDYDYFISSVAFFRSKVRDILNVIGSDIVDHAPDYISLGPGNGKKDQIFLKHIEERHMSKGEAMYYYPFDISPMMISQAIHAVTSIEPVNLKVKAIVGDFARDLKDFSPVYQYRPATNIFTLLGNTLGNLENEADFLSRVYQAMFEGDILILEVRLEGSESGDIGGKPEVNKRFDFTPLDLLGVQYEDEKLTYEHLKNRSTIPKTRTIAACYHDFHVPPDEDVIESAYLSYVHEYDREALLSVLTQEGFQLLRDFTSGRVLCAVLQKQSK